MLLRYRFSPLRGITLSFKPYSLAATEPMTLVPSRRRRFCVFLRMMAIYLTMSGGKTLRDGSSNLFGIRRHQNPALCPVKAIETYMAISAELGLDLSHGLSHYVVRNYCQ